MPPSIDAAFSLSLVGTAFYLGSLAIMGRRHRLPWILNLISLVPATVLSLAIGAYPNLIGCAIGAVICWRNIVNPPAAHPHSDHHPIIDTRG